MAKDTLFTNDSGAASGAIDYVKDVFDDVSLQATNNSGLTSTAATNPLGDLFANDDSPRFGAKLLYIKDLVLIADRSKWISNKPTYRIIWSDPYSVAAGYIFGNVSISYASGQAIVQVKTVGDGIGITGVIRRVAFLVAGDQSATATAQVTTDGVAGNTIDFSSLAPTADAGDAVKFNAYQHAAANETNTLHSIQLTALQTGTLKILGAVVYSENSGANIELFPGVTFVDKSKITTTTGASLALPAYGSSLGGKALIYKTQTSGYAMSALSATSVLSIAQGTNGTNLLTVSTGHGASFPAGTGFVVAQGASMYVGSVLSVSTDTLTVSPTLGFGISNAIYRSWLGGSTYSINASLMQLSHSIDFYKYSGLSHAIYDPQGRWAGFGSNIGSTAIDGVPAVFFSGASGFIQFDGRFSAASIEMIGNGILNATLSVNGVPAWSINAGQTGALKRTLFAEGGVGWNSFLIQPGTSMGVSLGISKINLYERSRDMGVTFGALASLDTLQAFTERTAINATLMALGTAERVYADQLQLSGGWVRGATIGAPGGALYSGATTNSVLKFQYYGKNFSILGTAGAGSTLLVDGAGVALTFNAVQTVASEGFHTVQFTNGSATSIIQAVDYSRSNYGLKSLQNFNTPAAVQTWPKARYTCSSTAAVTGTPTVINFEAQVEDPRLAVTIGSTWKFTAPETGTYAVDVLIYTNSGANSVNGVCRLDLYKNGLAKQGIAISTMSNTAAASAAPSGRTTIRLVAGDAIDCRISQNTGNAFALQGDPTLAWIDIYKLPE